MTVVEQQIPLPSIKEIQAQMRRLKLKRLGESRIGQLIVALEKKRRLQRSLMLVSSEQFGLSVSEQHVLAALEEMAKGKEKEEVVA